VCHQITTLLEETKFDIGNMVGCCSAPFIIDDINSSILLLKPGKSGGVSGCLPDHIINGTHKLRDHITILFNIMISHGFASIDFRLFTLVSIPQNKRKSINVSGN